MASVQADSPSMDSIGSFKVGSGSQVNVMLLLAIVLATFASSQLQNSAVEAQATLDQTKIEVNLSDKEMAGLQTLTAQEEAITSHPDNKGNYSTQQQNELSDYNTQFSMEMQNGNMNVQTIQGFVQGLQSIMDADNKAQSSTASTAQVLSQFLQFTSTLLNK